MEDNLQKFGKIFQMKCLAALITDKPFLEQSCDIVNPKYFESDANAWIAQTILWYFENYKNTPTLEVFKGEVDKIEQSHLKISVVEYLRTLYRADNLYSSDLPYIKDQFLEFCKNQALKNAIISSTDLLASGDYENIKTVIDKALNAGTDRYIGHDWKLDFDKRITEEGRVCIPTPWAVVNDIMNGGLGSGELGCIMAPSGAGKSWVLSAIGSEALLQGKHVAHFTLELSEYATGLRYDTLFSGIEPGKIKEYRQRMQGVHNDTPGNLTIRYFPMRSISANSIRAQIKLMTNIGKRPDLIIVDYADLLHSSAKANAKHEELGYIYEELVGVLGEFGIPGWTASQSQRSSIQDDVIEADKIAGAYGKVMPSHFVMSCSRKMSDKITNTARFHIVKNRSGPDGMTFPAEMDLIHGNIQLYDNESPEGIKVTAKSLSGVSQLKADIKKKWIEFSTESD